MPSTPDDPQDPITNFLRHHQSRTEDEQRILRKRERDRDYYERIGRARYEERKPKYQPED